MRFDKNHAKTTAKDFMMSTNARLWPFVSDDVRDALIDQVVMNCVRVAVAVEACAPFAPDELIAFRSAIVAVLDDGIPMGPAGRRGLMFDHAIDARRERASKEGT